MVEKEEEEKFRKEISLGRGQGRVEKDDKEVVEEQDKKGEEEEEKEGGKVK